MIRDARCITYPGASGDAWWDHTQLLAQVDDAISIFKETHLDYIGLFAFDQSSVHASLGPDVLHVFDMNKGNRGKQQKQKVTIIPMNNPYPEFHGKPQKMTMDTGETKGIQSWCKTAQTHVTTTWPNEPRVSVASEAHGPRTWLSHAHICSSFLYNVFLHPELYNYFLFYTFSKLHLWWV